MEKTLNVYTIYIGFNTYRVIECLGRVGISLGARRNIKGSISGTMCTLRPKIY